MALVLVVRHGHAAGNAEHRFIGQSDVPLDEKGHAQAQALCDRLAGHALSRIVSSDLRRAVDTVTPLAARLGLPIEVDPRLREINNGEWTGLLPEEIANRWPELWNDYITGADVERPGGETWGLVRERVVAAVTDIATANAVALICTHGGPALNLARWALGIPPGGNVFRGPLGAVMNAAITTIDTDGPRLLSFNDAGHLQELPELRYGYEGVAKNDR